MIPDAEIALILKRVGRLLGREPRGFRAVTRGYTPAVRVVVLFDGGSSAFVKAGTDSITNMWLRSELRTYMAVSAPFLPRVLAADDGAEPILVLEDLTTGRWPPPWTRELVRRVLDTLTIVAATPPPSDTPALREIWPRERSGWGEVARDPDPFLSLQLCSSGWLARSLPTLLAAERSADIDGEALLHFDVRSDNICFTGDRTLFVDWNFACVGNPLVDVAAWLPSLAAENGPEPWNAGPGTAELATMFCGFWASRAGLPPPQGAGSVRAIQRAQLRTALPWVAGLLDLPPPDGAARAVS